MEFHLQWSRMKFLFLSSPKFQTWAIAPGTIYWKGFNLDSIFLIIVKYSTSSYQEHVLYWVMC